MNSWTQNTNSNDADINNDLQLNYKAQYQQLKRKYKFLIFVSTFNYIT
jgi:hypothetical protein